MKKRIFTVLLIAVLSVTALLACSAPENTSSSSDNSVTTPENNTKDQSKALTPVILNEDRKSVV